MSFRSCPSCGFLVAADTQICQFCSSDLARVDAANVEPVPARGQSPLDTTRVPRIPRRATATVGAALLLAAGLGAAVIVVQGRSSEQALDVTATTIPAIVASTTAPLPSAADGTTAAAHTAPAGPTTISAGEVATMPPGWIDVLSPDRSYQAWFPSEPEQSSVVLDGVPINVAEAVTGADPATTRHAVLITTAEGLASMGGPEQYLRGVAAGLQEGRELLRADYVLTSAGRPALDVHVAASDRQLLARLILAGDRLVTIQTAGPLLTDLGTSQAAMVVGFRLTG